MKSFKQYIREAFDFRLGGSANRGDVPKSFNELEKGDKIYFYKFDGFDIESSYSDTFAFDKLPFINSNYASLQYSTKSGDKFWLKVPMSDIEKDCTVNFSEFNKRMRSYVFSTYEMTKEEALEIAKEWKGRLKLKESVDFRLGGKNNVDGGNFAFSRLRLGDDVYCVNVDTRNWKVIGREQGVFERSKEMYERMFVYFLVNKRACTCPVPKEKYEISSVHIEPSPIYDNEAKIYSTYYVEDDEAIELAKEWKGRLKLKESVDFRLGGKANKGSSQKTIDELEAGDTYYIWKCEFNFKLVYKDERNVKTVTKDEVGNVIYFESIGEWESMNRFEHKYADDDTMLIMSGTRFYFYATHDMTDEEVVKKIKEKRDSKNYKT